MRALHLLLATGLCTAIGCVVHRTSTPLPECSPTTTTSATLDGKPIEEDASAPANRLGAIPPSQ